MYSNVVFLPWKFFMLLPLYHLGLQLKGDLTLEEFWGPEPLEQIDCYVVKYN